MKCFISGLSPPSLQNKTENNIKGRTLKVSSTITFLLPGKQQICGSGKFPLKHRSHQHFCCVQPPQSPLLWSGSFPGIVAQMPLVSVPNSAPCSEDISPNPLQITKSLWSSWVWDHDMPKREFQGTLTYFLLFYLYFCKNKVFINVQVCMCEHVKSHLFLVENTTNFRQYHCPAGEAEEIKTCPSSSHFHRYICPWLNAETQPSVLNQARQQHTSLLKKRRKN